MQAIIIAGGKGTRLKPLTFGCPKPMLPLLDRPFLEWMVSRCRAVGITDILINVHYQAHQVVNYFRDGDRFGVQIRYIEESTPLDTAGAIKLAEPYFTGESLIIFNADILTDLNLAELIKFHQTNQAAVTLALKTVEDITPFGLVELDQNSQVLAFREKPTPAQAVDFLAKGINTINAGTYVIEPRVFTDYPVGEPLSFERVVFPEALKQGLKMMGFVSDGYWMDLGTPQKYYQAHIDILQELIPYDLGSIAHSPSAGIWIANRAEVHPDAKLESPCFIGDRSYILSNAMIPANTVIGANCLVNRGISSGIYANGSMLL
ncbi:Nucleoside-diphosphate-sugar pyrophosphorylase family protein [Synechococcus sp. PCC 7502]|uniref:nucleotidyltransferase family protein n=1 Tax=Synechococcus sp. PCC 7502 TaxID=1173263 RepID=UPI00029FC383|nr:NDP-sugar synthase [Synechococcus sp. PCC 7502]AFY73410.1 Nucleoside-diphosphate-sugar pyrophosphorylase family protein [Synechococcus sp. PCC 7502]